MPSDRERRAAFFHAFSDPTRLSIVEALGRGECCVSDLAALIGAAQSRLSFHLRVLREAGIVLERREGRHTYYHVMPEALGRAASMADALQPRARGDARRGCECDVCRRR